jgi:6-phosphogluconolactonase/glucosamine-6-phosphate isomerase/deaminase
MDQHFFFPLKIQNDKIHFFDGASQDLVAECKRIDNFISEKGHIDLVMVGLGLNGHIGLNEPGVDFDLYSHFSPLDEKTKEVAQKYFTDKVLLTKGITLGPRHLLEAEVAILIASGINKAEIIKKALEQEVSNSVPASILQNHRDAYVFLDQNAASLLSNKAVSNG